jgi:hypothetical protein
VAVLFISIGLLTNGTIAIAATSSAVASLQGNLSGGSDPVTVTLPVVNLISPTATIKYQINSGAFQSIPAGNTPTSFTINQGDTFGIAALASASTASPLYSRAWALQDVLFIPNGNSGTLSFLANSAAQLQGIGAFANAYTQFTTVEALGAVFLATHFDGKPGSFDFSGDMTLQSKLFAEASVPVPESGSLLLMVVSAAACGILRWRKW